MKLFKRNKKPKVGTVILTNEGFIDKLEWIKREILELIKEYKYVYSAKIIDGKYSDAFIVSDHESKGFTKQFIQDIEVTIGSAKFIKLIGGLIPVYKLEQHFSCNDEGYLDDLL